MVPGDELESAFTQCRYSHPMRFITKLYILGDSICTQLVWTNPF